MGRLALACLLHCFYLWRRVGAAAALRDTYRPGTAWGGTAHLPLPRDHEPASPVTEVADAFTTRFVTPSLLQHRIGGPMLCSLKVTEQNLDTDTIEILYT